MIHKLRFLDVPNFRPVKIIACAAVLLVQNALSEQLLQNPGANLQTAPLPSWVTIGPEDIEELKSLSPVEKGKGAISNLLLEKRIDVASEAWFFRHVNRINTESGLQSGSQVKASVDPSYQQAFIHRLTIIRNGEEIDCLPNQRFRTISQEQDQYRQIYNNGLAFIGLVEGTRVGDIIDFAYSVTRHKSRIEPNRILQSTY